MSTYLLPWKHIIVAWTVPSIQKSMAADRMTCNDLIDLLEGSNLVIFYTENTISLSW